MTYIVQAGQCIADIAIEVYGDVRGAFWLLDDNPILTNITDRLLIGQVLQLRADQLNSRYVTYLADFAPFASVEEADFASGIGAWWLEEYKVQPYEEPTRNIAPLATVSASSVYPGFPLPQNVVAEPYVWLGWGSSGWNDATNAVFPDWLELNWPTDQSVMGLEITFLTNGLELERTTDPTVTSGYVPYAYAIQALINDVWTTVASETTNTFVYRKYLFSRVVTRRIRITITESFDGLFSRITQIKVLDN